MLRIGCHLSAGKGFLHMGKPRCNNYDCTIEVIVRNKAAANVPESESKEN